MGVVVVTGAQLMCPFGTATSSLTATAQTTCQGSSNPIATIADVALGTNIPPFAMCTSMSNPAVASATAAALGVLTPQPCSMAPAGTWIPSKPTVLVGGNPVLTLDATLMCSVGMGNIKIVSPGQTSIITG